MHVVCLVLIISCVADERKYAEWDYFQPTVIPASKQSVAYLQFNLMIGHPPLQYQQSLLTKPTKSVSPSTAASEFSNHRTSTSASAIPYTVSVNTEPRPALYSVMCDKPAYHNIRNIKGVNPSSHRKGSNPILHMWILLLYPTRGYSKEIRELYLNPNWKRCVNQQPPCPHYLTHIGIAFSLQIGSLTETRHVGIDSMGHCHTVSDTFIINKLNRIAVNMDISL